MTSRPGRSLINGSSALEAVAAGLAYGAGLCWISVCLLANFRPGDLGGPYWSGAPHLRSDTCGILAFFAVAVCFGTSEYLRLRRRRDAMASSGRGSSRKTTKPFVLAASETTTILATGLVIYVSVNAVTHPETLDMRATHLATWPTEGTLRVVALLLCVCSVAVLRYLFAERASGSGSRPAGPSSIESIDNDEAGASLSEITAKRGTLSGPPIDPLSTVRRPGGGWSTEA
jgi:hypothetical protein